MNFLFALLFAALCALQLQFAAAHPIAAARDVYTPPVTYPTAGTTWAVGETHNVTWDTTNPPKQITNGEGQIYLRKGDNAIKPILLASEFSILLGSFNVTVPSVAPASDYIINLFGDSGDWSPEFTITA
ncbi:hypothetical protein PLICRDRAFT_104298 [Plicaturopsis crispa FD-325 SS-3]|nr:hypothetical protein PLICRDRAFT_104298 [Plicaturopsis crispa FD-325 SS-3]